MVLPIRVPARERLINALALGETFAKAARMSGYARQSVYRLMWDPKFRAEVEARREGLPWPDAAARAVLARVLRGAMRGEVGPAERTDAADVILELASRWPGSVELDLARAASDLLEDDERRRIAAGLDTSTNAAPPPVAEDLRDGSRLG